MISDDYTADPYDNTKFYRCANSYQYSFKCAPGTIYYGNGFCNYAVNSASTNSPFYPTNSPYYPTNSPYYPTNPPYYPTNPPYYPTNSPYYPTNPPYYPTTNPTVSPFC